MTNHSYAQRNRRRVRRLRIEPLEPRLLLSLTTLVDNGPPANRVDMVFLGDGYTAAELAEYADHVDATVAHFFEGGEEPFHTYRSYFNVHRIDTASTESGADHPSRGVFRDTAFDAAYECGGMDRLICLSVAKANSVLEQETADGSISTDIRMMAVNDATYGGAGGYYAAFAARNGLATDLALHELGHSFAGLADEYGGGGRYPGGEPRAANVTLSPDGEKWSPWLGYQQPEIGTIGAYEGGNRFDEGIYRPSLKSKMRSLGHPFDVVSREEILLDIYAVVDPLDAWTDNRRPLVSSAPSLSVQPIDAQIIELEWMVDGVPIEGFAEATLAIEQVGLAEGRYQVSVRAADRTDWVRRDRERLEQVVTWDVVYSTEPVLIVELPDLTISENGGSAEGRVLRQHGSVDEDLVVNLSSSDDTELAVPPSVVIASGESFAEFSITGVDDRLLDGVQTAAVTPSAEGFIGVEDQIQIADHETLTIELSPGQFCESAGASASAGTVTRSNTDIDESLRVMLSLAEQTEVRFPGGGDTAGGSGSSGGVHFVSIPAGQPSAPFTLDAVDDMEIDGDQEILLVASADDYADGQQIVVVTDDDTLTISLDRAAVREDAGEGGVVATIKRSLSSREDPLTVQLSSSDSSELEVPPSVTVPAGASEVTVGLNVIDDELLDGAQVIDIVATAPGHSAGAACIVVEDYETWQNPFNVFDVNQDNRISPLDALLVINELSRNGARLLGDDVSERAFFWDVSGDARIAPVDALLIINNLLGEGEAEAEPPHVRDQELYYGWWLAFEATLQEDSSDGHVRRSADGV